MANSSIKNSSVKDISSVVHVVGAGLAGSECAFQLAERGHRVVLYEMRGGEVSTPAHKTRDFAELVCSNSFGSQTDYSAPGQLKWEAEALNSMILNAAKKNAVPAGMALSVDRGLFAAEVSHVLRSHPNIEVRSEVITRLEQLPRPAVIATGPLTHPELAEDLRRHFDNEFLYFFDAIAPIIATESINMDIAWKGDRFGKGTKDYLNCPMDQETYTRFIEEVKAARKITPKEFETTPYFDGCMPIEAIIDRGDQTLRYGPLSPKGLRNPRTGKPAYAVVQLRQDNREGTAFNMVGFQTRMAYGEQTRVFRMIPGLEEAEFLKLGSIHRNLYIQSPKKLSPVLSSRSDEWLFFAGQITGVEGYFESTCIGLLVAGFIDDKLNGKQITLPPRASAMGSLLNAITEDNEEFQPTNINFGLFPKVMDHVPRNRKEKEYKRSLQLHLAKKALAEWIPHHRPWLTQRLPTLPDFAVDPRQNPTHLPHDKREAEAE